MGKLINFVSNIGADNKSAHETPPYIRLKLFNKRLERQIKKMEFQESRARKKAIEARKLGKIEQARNYIKSSLQFQKWIHSSEIIRMKMEEIQLKLERAKMMENFSEVAEGVAIALNSLKTQVNMPEISRIVNDLKSGFEEVDKVMKNISDQIETAEDNTKAGVSDTEVEEELSKLDMVIGLDQGGSLPSAPEEIISEQESEQNIDDLEKEIKKLKAQRN